MKVMLSSEHTNLERFRQDLYNSFNYRADALMDLLDALVSNRSAQSVVELSLNPLFQRQYCSLFDGLDNFLGSDSGALTAARRAKEEQLLRLIAPFLPLPQKRGFWLFGCDATTIPRPFAATLPDRGFQYQPNTLRGNKPVTIGHAYSTLAFLPEKESGYPPWLVPMMIRRITTSESEIGVCFEMLKTMLNDESLPFHGQTTVLVADSKYNNVKYIYAVAEIKNLVTITRCRAFQFFIGRPNNQKKAKEREATQLGMGKDSI